MTVGQGKIGATVKADPNVVSMNLYSPKGKPFGTFTTDHVDFNGASIALPTNLNIISEDDQSMHFYSKVASSHPHCCQCNVSGTSTNGEYYYVLESTVSKSELNTVLAGMKWTFAWLAVGNHLVAFGVARFLSRRLVKNIRVAVDRVRSIKTDGNISERIGIEGIDEVAFLTKEFDKLLDQREKAQELLLEAEKTASKAQLARVVAHNIRSPIIAIEMVIPQLFMIPERTRKVLENSVAEIKELSERLKLNPENVTTKLSTVEQVGSQVLLPLLLENLINQKQTEYRNRKDIQITLFNEVKNPNLYVKVKSVEFRSVLSNLVNNAVESYGESGGTIAVVLSVSDQTCAISVIDKGCGMRQDQVQKIGREQFTSKKGNDRGLGLTHAVQSVEAWGGRINFHSEVGIGTRATIELSRQERTGLLQKLSLLIS